MGTGGLERVEHVFDAHLEILGQFWHARRTAGLAGQRLLSLFDLERHLLRTTRDVDRPAQVTEVALELAEDCGHGKRRERCSSVRVKAINRLDQAKARYLKQVLERLSRTGVASGQLASKGKETGDELVTCASVAVLLPANEQLGRVGSGDR